jgi:FkbM family methyltransferase
MKNEPINNFKIPYTELTFVTDKAYWNLNLNSLLQLKLEADITPDINSFIRNNADDFKKVYDAQISASEQATRYGSMSGVGIKMTISTNETLTLIFTRIWYSKTICHAACNPDRSYIYVEALTSNYHRTFYNTSSKNGKTIKFPMILNITEPELNECCLGPEDPRIVLDENNQMFLSFNMIDVDKRRKIWSYDIFTNYQAPFYIQNHQSLKVEKNWTPFIKDNKLYFVYSYNPLKVLQCPNRKGACKFISNPQSSYQSGVLRGGTQLVKFRDSDYFVGIARTTISCHKCQRFYRPHIVVLSTNLEKFHLAYVSEPLMLDNIPMFASYYMLQNRSSPDFCDGIIRIMTPGSIIDWKWPDDKLTFTLSINDKRSFIVSITGIGKVLQDIIFAIKSKYFQFFFNSNLDLNMVSYSEAMALDYCESVSKTNKLSFEQHQVNKQYSKEKIIKNIIDSPTYPKFRVTSNTDGKVLSSWIKTDFVNFGLIGRYLMEYESANGNLAPGTHMMIDAGGNHGTYALYGASLNQSVLVFEVLPDYWVLIQESIRINPKLSKRMTLYPFGVGDENRIWKVIPGEGLTHLEFIKSETSNILSEKLSNDFTIIQTYPLDDFVFQKVSVLKIDVEGFEIRTLKGASQVIRGFGVGAVLVEIAPNRWSSNNITMNEGISVLEQVTSVGNYMPYIITRNDASCPTSKISKINSLTDIKNLSMINFQNGKFEFAPQIFRLNEWATIMIRMKNNDWSCNFWLESDVKRVITEN